MYSKLKRNLEKLRTSLGNMLVQPRNFDEIKINQGRILAAMNRQKHMTDLQAYEFRVFSQWGEDGIIQRLVDVVEIKNKTFIEFGVETFHESNCRFLMVKDNWSGFVIDGSSDNISRLRKSYFYWHHDLNSHAAFITKDNINDLLAMSGFDPDLGILSIDIDGVDYFVLEAIRTYRPRILIAEYNAVFGATRKITVPYDASFQRAAMHHSTLYFGASLAALNHLAVQKGYTLVGTNSAGANAFFVRRDLMSDQLIALTSEQAFTNSKGRESRNQFGELTFVGGDARAELIKDLPVLEVERNVVEKF